MRPAEIRLDLERSRRIGMPEAVLCEPKSAAQAEQAVVGLLEGGDDAVIATRVREHQRDSLLALEPESVEYDTMVWRPRSATGFRAAVVSAGTSDLPVASEASITLRAMGHDVALVTDVGVAGLHRLLDARSEFEHTHGVIVVAGMEGALPTVLAGMIEHPIVAVPTSVGYGASFEGVTPLLTMLASCAPGIAVVGIDNGYGAACALHRTFKR